MKQLAHAGYPTCCRLRHFRCIFTTLPYPTLPTEFPTYIFQVLDKQKTVVITHGPIDGRGAVGAS